LVRQTHRQYPSLILHGGGAEIFTDPVLLNFTYSGDLIFFRVTGEEIACWLPVYTIGSIWNPPS
jgi:hypothetical protein